MFLVQLTHCLLVWGALSIASGFGHLWGLWFFLRARRHKRLRQLARPSLCLLCSFWFGSPCIINVVPLWGNSFGFAFFYRYSSLRWGRPSIAGTIGYNAVRLCTSISISTLLSTCTLHLHTYRIVGIHPLRGVNPFSIFLIFSRRISWTMVIYIFVLRQALRSVLVSVHPRMLMPITCVYCMYFACIPIGYLVGSHHLDLYQDLTSISIYSSIHGSMFPFTYPSNHLPICI